MPLPLLSQVRSVLKLTRTWETPGREPIPYDTKLMNIAIAIDCVEPQPVHLSTTRRKSPDSRGFRNAGDLVDVRRDPC